MFGRLSWAAIPFDVPIVMITAGTIGTVLAAVLLLVAIIAAISLTMRRRPGLKVQDIAKQVGVRAKDRVRIVKMNPEKRS